MNASLFTPHGFCIAWDPALLWVMMVGNAAIAAAYFAIPAMLLSAIPRIRAIIPWWLLVMFAAFIVACGSGHIIKLVTIWYPVYWLEGAWDLATGAVSMATVFALPVGVFQILDRERDGRRPAGQ